MLRLSSDIQAADPVEPAQGALHQEGGGQRAQGRQHQDGGGRRAEGGQHPKELHSQRTQGFQLCQSWITRPFHPVRQLFGETFVAGKDADDNLDILFIFQFEIAGKEAAD